MIRRLEQAGLGYHIQADATVDKLGTNILYSYIHVYKRIRSMTVQNTYMYMYVYVPRYIVKVVKYVGISGQVPMRRLVYRVQALPQSMLPLVWDFGQLDIGTEQRYIKEMVNKCVSIPVLFSNCLTLEHVIVIFCLPGWRWRCKHVARLEGASRNSQSHSGEVATVYA